MMIIGIWNKITHAEPVILFIFSSDNLLFDL